MTQGEWMYYGGYACWFLAVILLVSIGILGAIRRKREAKASIEDQKLMDKIKEDYQANGVKSKNAYAENETLTFLTDETKTMDLDETVLLKNK